jgi:hypothetical protein
VYSSGAHHYKNIRYENDMGGLLSRVAAENISNQMIRNLVNVTNTATQNCRNSASQYQLKSISNLTDSNVFSFGNMTQTVVVETKCVQEAAFDSKVTQEITQQAEQVAKAISQMFQLGDTESKNLVNLSSDLGTQVLNAFTQNCTSEQTQTQVTRIDNLTRSNAVVVGNMSQYVNIMTACVTKDAAVNQVATKIDQATKQTATATVENFLAGIFGSIFAIVAVVGVIFFIILLIMLPKGGGGGGVNVNVGNPVDQSLEAEVDALLLQRAQGVQKSLPQ